MSKKKRKRRDPYAATLRDPMFRQRRTAPHKVYDRSRSKRDHMKRVEEEELTDDEIDVE